MTPTGMSPIGRPAILRLVLSLLLLLSSAIVRAYEEWIPMVANFTSADFGSARNTWRISTSGEWTFFANQRGLLEYNGKSWHRYQLNNRSEVRSVMVMSDQQRVWVGGEFEFGYFDVGPQGTLQYHCESDSLPADVHADLGNVFDFYEMGGITYARCDYYIIMIAGAHRTIIHSPEKIFASTMWNGTVYVATDGGIMMLTGHQLLPVESEDMPASLRVNTMIPFDKGILIASATNGLYYYDGFTIRRYETPVDALLRDGCVCSMASRGSRLAFGTLTFGLIVLDQKTGDVEKYDNSCGLQSNMVQSVAFDQQGNLWCGLNTGIDHVLLATPFTTLYRNPRSYGMGYTCLLDSDKLYLGTNQGLFYAPYPVVYHDRQTVLLGTGIPLGTAWYLYKHGDAVLLMHDHGVFLVEGNKCRHVPQTQGVWACIAVEGHPDLLFCGAYAGVYVLQRSPDGQYQSLGRIEGITEPGRFMRYDASGHLSLYNPHLDSVHVYQLDSTLLRAVSVTSRHEVYVPSTTIGQQLALPDFGPARQILTLSGGKRHIIPYEQGFMMVNTEKMKNESRSVLIESLFATEPADSLLYRASFSGFKPHPTIAYRYRSLRFEYKAAPLYPRRDLLYQVRLVSGDQADTTSPDGWSEPTGSLFRSYSNLREGDYTFQVRTLLAGQVQGEDSFAFTITPPWYRTWIAYAAFALLLVVAAIALWLMENRRLERRKAAALKEKNEEVRQMKVEIDKLEKDKLELDLRHKSQEIANLMVNMSRKNEILNSLKTDILRVANRMGIDTPAQNKRNLVLIGNKIDLNMEGDDVLKRFEEEFDLVNNNFMKALTERHPDLSSSERLMCAYLKMNLSTKEIAPLLNISVRGVETMRYRIRKKFGLDRDNSLTDYMNSLAEGA